MTGPLVAVVSASRCSGRSIGNNRLTMQWWDLKLVCGHRAERPLRFPKQTGTPVRGFAILHRPRSVSEALPAPKRVRCAACKATGTAVKVAPKRGP